MSFRAKPAPGQQAECSSASRIEPTPHFSWLKGEHKHWQS